MHKNSYLRIAACLVSAIFLLMVSVGLGQGKDNSGNPSPVGTWYGYAGPEGGDFLRIWMMPTFFADGNIIANDSLELLAAGPHSTAHGTWKWTHAKQFEATFYWLNLDPEGNYLGSNKVVLTGEIDPKHKDEIINGKITATVFPASCGNPLRPNPGCQTSLLGEFVIKELLRAQ